MKSKQRGFIDIPKGAFEILVLLAIIGLVAVFSGAGWAIVWLFNHVRFV